MRVLYNERINKESATGAQLYFASHVKDYKNQFKRLMHMHEDFVEIIYVTQGCGKYQVDGIYYEVNAGDLLVFNSYVAHDEYLIEQDSLETYCCGIKGLNKIGLRADALIPDNVAPVFSLEDDADCCYHFMALVFLLLERKDIEKAQSVTNAFLRFLEEFVFSERAEAPEYDNDNALFHVKEFIENYYYEDINLEQLADMVNISPYYLSHQYKEKFNCSPVKYLIKRRIGEAQTLLQNTDESIMEIAFSVGFNNPCHFQSTFKRMVGVTPKSYRDEYNKVNEDYDKDIKISSSCLKRID